MITEKPATIYFKDPQTDGGIKDLSETTKENPHIFLYKPTIEFTRGEEINVGGEVTLTRNGKPYTMPTDGKIKDDGEYVMMVDGIDENGRPDNTRATVYFVVDTKGPSITNIKTGICARGQKVRFEDVDDVEEAVLTDLNGNVKDNIKQYLTDNETNEYIMPSEPGKYILKATDKYGNTTKYTVVIQ